jgi:LacI family transcriptional regulator
MRRVLSSRRRPTAVLASNDLTAIGAMGAIAEAGLRVPEDISVIGFDDIQMSAFVSPPLTTVAMPRAKIAAAAFHALFREESPRAAKSLKGEMHIIQPALVLRKSTGPARRK